MMDTQQRINLGHAKNQATNILSTMWENILPPSERKEIYKSLVKLFYKWNSELDSEILGTGKEQDSETTTQKRSSQSLNLPPKDFPTPLSDKQKRCLRYRQAIPKTFTFHEECGRSE